MGRPISMQCLQKRYYSSKQEAEAARITVTQKGGAWWYPVKVFHCGYCEGFHIGGVTPRKRRVFM